MFPAEDGIRAHCVTGVQACARPIFTYWPCGVRCIGGANLIQAFVWNLRTWSEMLRENAQAEEPRGRNTDALIRGGRLRSSVEAIVMIVEQRKPAIDVWFGSTGNRKNPLPNGRRQPSLGCTS